MRVLALSLLAAGCTTYVTETRDDAHERSRDQVGGVVITEVMLDPDACEDRAAEWIEVQNTSAVEVDLSELVLVNRAGAEARIAAPHLLRPGQTAQVARGDWDSYCVGQPHPDNYFEGHLELDNDAEQLQLVDGDGQVLDQTPLFSGDWIVEGASISLLPDAHEAWANDDIDVWYLGHECVNTAGNSPDNPNAECFVDVPWFGLDCDDDGCALPPDFDPVPHLVNAHRIASGVADERIDVEDDGLYFHNLRFEPPAPVDTDAFVPGEAHWVVTFVTYGDDLWGHTNLFVELDIQAGTVEMYEDFAHDSLAKVRVEELEELAVSADAVVDALDRSWSWWGDVGFGALNRAVYEDTLQWTVVSEDGDDRWSYDAVTGVRTDR